MGNNNSQFIGHWKIDKLDYNLITKNIVVNVTCVKCGNKFNFEIKRKRDLKDIECNTCNKIDEESNLISYNRGNKESYDDTKLDISTQLEDKYIREKLRKIWLKMQNNKEKYLCDEWRDFEKFKEWADSNGYKPWKTLIVFDETVGYTPDNCSFQIDKRGISDITESIAEKDNLSLVVKKVKKLSYNIIELNVLLSDMDYILGDLLKSQKIKNRENIADCLTGVKDCLNRVNKFNKLIDGLELDMEK